MEMEDLVSEPYKFKLRISGKGQRMAMCARAAQQRSKAQFALLFTKHAQKIGKEEESFVHHTELEKLIIKQARSKRSIQEPVGKMIQSLFELAETQTSQRRIHN